jgi:hypothetical protein
VVGYSINQNKIRNDFDVINNLLNKCLYGRFQAIGHSVLRGKTFDFESFRVQKFRQNNFLRLT